MFYFGCHQQAGHYLFGKGMRSGVRREAEKVIPFKWSILDGGLLPPALPETQGRAHISHINGWTVLTFWDRSVDSRPGCNSSFLCPGTWDFDAMVNDSKVNFPEVWKRLPFAVWDAVNEAP